MSAMNPPSDVEVETSAPAAPERQPVAGPRWTPVVVTLGVFAVSIVSWWLLGDPEWSISGARSATPEEWAANSAVVSCLLFWTIFGHIFTGFTFGTWPFNKLEQPAAGSVQVAVDVLIGILGTVLFTRGLGSWDPTFSASTPGGAGYTATAFIVLIGFYAYALPAAGLAGFPFDRIDAPAGLMGRWLLGAVLTTIGVVALVYPNFSPALAADAPMSLGDATGWIYSSIVLVILSAQLWGNVMWSSISNRHVRALSALVLTLAGGAVLMVIFEAILHLVVPATIAAGPSFDYSLEAAQLGVCIALTALLAGLVFPQPAGHGRTLGILVRTAVVLVSGLVLYVVFMRFFAVEVLHFPALSGSYGGNPLLWMDWAVLVLLWHAVAFGGRFGRRPAGRRQG